MHDPVDHPNHYTNGNIETIDYIQDTLTSDEFRGYIKGNVLKYVSRERYKGGLEDIRKAIWYLNRYVESVEKTNDIASIADALTPLSTKPIVPDGMDAQNQLRQRTLSERLNNENMTIKEFERLMADRDYSPEIDGYS